MRSKVLCYFGDFDRVFLAASHALRVGASLALTVEALETEDEDEDRESMKEARDDDEWRIDSSGRYRHSKAYVQRLAVRWGFEVLTYKRVLLRRRHSSPDANPVFAHLFVLLRAA